MSHCNKVLFQKNNDQELFNTWMNPMDVQGHHYHRHHHYQQPQQLQQLSRLQQLQQPQQQQQQQNQQMPHLDYPIPIMCHNYQYASGVPVVTAPSIPDSSIISNDDSYVNDYHHHNHQTSQQQSLSLKSKEAILKEFWVKQYKDIEALDNNQIKEKCLPLARIKKIMKLDEDVNMISSEVPILFAKACELFILELTERAWIHTEEGKRRTLQKVDIVEATTSSDIFDFLIDIIPRNLNLYHHCQNQNQNQNQFGTATTTTTTGTTTIMGMRENGYSNDDIDLDEDIEENYNYQQHQHQHNIRELWPINTHSHYPHNHYYTD